MRERLQKILARSGVASRRGAEEMVDAGRVEVNGRTAGLGDSADVAVDEIRLDGRPLGRAPRRRVLALHKPAGYVTTLSDPQGRPTVRDLLPGRERLMPIGRLDLDSEGLLLFTNDGGIAQKVAHPSGGVHKRYRAWVPGRPTPSQLRDLRLGLELDDGHARALGARVLPPEVATRGLRLAARQGAGVGESVVELEMGEGRKREVRRLLSAVGLPVLRLVRVAVGPVTLTGLAPGRYRYLSEPEVGALLAGLREGRTPRSGPEDRRPERRLDPRSSRSGGKRA